MKKKILSICILYLGILSIINAQTCDCLLLLDNAKSEVQQYYHNKQLPQGEIMATKAYDKFKPFANLPHTTKDCQELLADYLDMFEDDNVRRQIKVHLKQKNKQI